MMTSLEQNGAGDGSSEAGTAGWSTGDPDSSRKSGGASFSSWLVSLGSVTIVSSVSMTAKDGERCVDVDSLTSEEASLTDTSTFCLFANLFRIPTRSGQGMAW